MRFEFATATRILFGPGSARELPEAAKSLGRRALLVTGRASVRAASLAAQLDVVSFRANGEPTVAIVEEGVRTLLSAECDLVIALGGGSAIDAGKAIAAIASNPGDIYDYLEVVGRGRPIEQPSLPFVAVPTTAGTGSEVTRNAVIASPEHRVKASLRSPHMLPRLAVVDPELTLDLPPETTAATGLDALTQLIEPFVSPRATPLTDMFCRDGIRRAARSIEKACADGENLEARTDMSMASLLGGLSLANAGLGAVHGFAAPIGGMFDAPHGAVCAALLPHVMQANIAALRKRAPDSAALGRYREIATLLTGGSSAPEDAIPWLTGLVSRLGIPPLSAHGIKGNDLKAIAEKAAMASSMRANPIALTAEELGDILLKAL